MPCSRNLLTATIHLGIAAALLLAPSSSAVAQIPDKYTNLQVLPKETTKGELVSKMRGFAGALGVRCNHCHVGKNADTLEGFDFASDDKEPKKVARAMMRMTQEINDKLLPATGREKLHPVSCVTCHRGATLPLTLYETLTETAHKDGLDAAIKQYRELRQSHYGDGQYDFGPGTLSAFAETRAREEKDLDGALTIARLNAEFNPSAPWAQTQIGQLCLQKGDRDCALAAFGKAAELAPNDAWIKKQLESLKAPPKP